MKFATRYCVGVAAALVLTLSLSAVLVFVRLVVGTNVSLPPGVSIRVAKGLGSRGYDRLRVSLISWDASCGAASSECVEQVDWAMKVDIKEHPDRYEGLSASSAFEDVQAYLASHGQGDCVTPCAPDENALHHVFLTQPQGTSDVTWSYSAPFRYRWEDNSVSTALVQVVPGRKTTLTVDGFDIDFKIPVEGQGSIGMLVGDPCIRYDPWYCKYANEFQVKDTLHTVLNTMADHDELDYWMIFGDLFYDQSGNITREFFAGLTSASSSVLGATLGNHDYWVMGNPGAASSDDSFGNGHMQWYAQDTVGATLHDSQPFDFSQNPSEYKIVDISNTFWYYTMGNVAFIGFSNAYEWEDTKPYFEEACQWVKSTNPALVFLMGHWNTQNGGCSSGMATETAFSRVQELVGCDTLGSRIKFVEGHKHCNQIKENNTGYVLGAFGFVDSDASCDGAFGVPILDTRNGWARLYYFELGLHGKRTENFDVIVDCFKTKGYSKCTQLAQVWMEEDLTSSLSKTCPSFSCGLIQVFIATTLWLIFSHMW